LYNDTTRCSTDAWNKNLLKKMQSNGTSVTESAYRQTASAIKWPRLILGAWTCHGTGRCLPLCRSGPEVTTSLALCSDAGSRHQVQTVSAGPAMPCWLGLVCGRAPPCLEIRGVSGYLWSSCTALLLLISLCRDEP